jgi:hypothetical protein
MPDHLLRLRIENVDVKRPDRCPFHLRLNISRPPCLILPVTVAIAEDFSSSSVLRFRRAGGALCCCLNSDLVDLVRYKCAGRDKGGVLFLLLVRRVAAGNPGVGAAPGPAGDGYTVTGIFDIARAHTFAPRTSPA